MTSFKTDIKLGDRYRDEQTGIEASSFELAQDIAPIPRFWSKVAPTSSGCWIWTAAKVTGYGRFKFGDAIRSAHRLSYEWLVGPIPEGLHLDHLCRNRACVNPEHLEPVTCRDNVLRGIGPSAQHAVKTHCPSGHEYSEENTYLYRGMRYCAACRAEHSAASRDRGADALAADAGDPRHGTVAGYSTYRCRCSKCRSAWRGYTRDRRALKTERAA